MDFRLRCTLYINTMKGELTFVTFTFDGSDQFLLTLNELKNLEVLLKSIKYKFNRADNKINLNCTTIWSIPIIFNKLYDDCE